MNDSLDFGQRKIQNLLETYFSQLNSGARTFTDLAHNAQYGIVDAFSRQRTSTPYTIFDSKQTQDALPLQFDTATTGAGTSSTYSQNRASTTLGVSNLTAGSVIRQTRQRFNYQPGKSHLVIRTFVVGQSGTGITKRWGYFTAQNGAFFDVVDGALGVNIRSNVTGTPTDTRITQANFNVDKLDGSGVSGFNLDLNKANIYFLQLQWLGVGNVAFGVYDGFVPVIAHIFENANTLTSVYMSTPNLPVRTEIVNSGTGAAATIEEICSSVISEGGFEQNGIVFAVDRGITGFSTGASTSVMPVLSVRLKADHLGSTVGPVRISLIGTLDVDYRWALILNPTVAGVDAASWQSLANASVEFDISRNTTNTLTGGTVLESGYGVSAGGPSGAGGALATGELSSELLIGSSIADVPDQLVFAVQNLTAATNTYYASITFRDLQ